MPTIAEYCSHGGAHIYFQELVALKSAANDPKYTFGDYNDKVKQLLKEEDKKIVERNETSLASIPRRGHRLKFIEATDGSCIIYDKENNRCMLGYDRPEECVNVLVPSEILKACDDKKPDAQDKLEDWLKTH